MSSDEVPDWARDDVEGNNPAPSAPPQEGSMSQSDPISAPDDVIEPPPTWMSPGQEEDGEYANVEEDLENQPGQESYALHFDPMCS